MATPWPSDKRKSMQEIKQGPQKVNLVSAYLGKKANSVVKFKVHKFQIIENNEAILMNMMYPVRFF